MLRRSLEPGSPFRFCTISADVIRCLQLHLVGLSRSSAPPVGVAMFTCHLVVLLSVFTFSERLDLYGIQRAFVCLF